MYISDSVSEITTVLVVSYTVILIVIVMVNYWMTVVHVFVHLSLFPLLTVIYIVIKKFIQIVIYLYIY